MNAKERLLDLSCVFLNHTRYDFDLQAIILCPFTNNMRFLPRIVIPSGIAHFGDVDYGVG